MSDRVLRVVLFIALSGCSGTEETSPASHVGAEGDGPRDTLVIAFNNDAGSMLEVVTEAASDASVIANLNYPLVDTDFDCGLRYEPALAKSWSWNEDGTILSMELRDDIKWQDGEPVTAQDIAFTYGLIEDKTVASPLYAQIEQMVEGKRPLVIDPTHIEWHFTAAFDHATQLAQTSVATAPWHILKDADRATLRGNPFTTEPVVDGRWKLASWERNQRLVLEPNDAWTGPVEEKPKLKRIIFKVLPEYTTRLVELERGDIDLMQQVQVSDADRLVAEHPEIRIVRRGWRGMDYVAWNSIDPEDWTARLAALPPGTQPEIDTAKPHPILGDKAVRRALAKAVDIDKLIGDLLTSKASGEVYGRRAVGTISPALCDVHNDEIQPLPYALDQASAELEALGWKDTDGDGVRDKDGRPLRFSLLTSAGNPRRADAAVILQAQLKRAGVQMDIESVETNAFYERLRKKDVEAALAGWAAALFVDPTPLWHSGEEYAFNFTSYHNPAVDALIDQGMHTAEHDAAIPIWKQVQAEIYEDQPYLFLYWIDELVGVSNRFEGTKIDELSAFRDLHEWWVPADRVKYSR